MKTAAMLLLTIVGMSMTARSDVLKQPPKTDAERKAATVAEDYLAIKDPHFDKTGLTLVIIDRGSEWEVTYKLPPSSFGGSPHVFVDKSTFRVTRLRQEQ